MSPHLLKHFAVIDRQVARLEKLTTELLDVSRITSGRLELHREHFDLVVLVREIVERFRADQARGASSIVFESDPSVVGEWDPFRIDQVASNLVVNAIRYGEGKPVHVSVHAADDAARIIVRDEGIGIAADHKERIFERFERAVSSSNYGGLGLGLWIARQVVDAHDGGIDVDSEPGRGATFTVTLPAVDAGLRTGGMTKARITVIEDDADLREAICADAPLRRIRGVRLLQREGGHPAARRGASSRM